TTGRQIEHPAPGIKQITLRHGDIKPAFGIEREIIGTFDRFALIVTGDHPQCVLLGVIDHYAVALTGDEDPAVWRKSQSIRPAGCIDYLLTVARVIAAFDRPARHINQPD